VVLLIKTEPLDMIGLVKFESVSYLTFIIDSAFDLDHITALLFVTSPLAMPCVILGTFCWAVAITLVVAKTVMMDKIRIDDAITSDCGNDNNLPAVEVSDMKKGLKHSVFCS
jgi:hypothetical protein